MDEDQCIEKPQKAPSESTPNTGCLGYAWLVEESAGNGTLFCLERKRFYGGGTRLGGINQRDVTGMT
ncbi:hypothetical protein CEXT_275831 [Caerostris extrusa]|uniref:Uncharacterized protein n=1 Tax=Caerostris extrusa TaxID=172846 RepID=A0AAV4S702_CAEEX|nr:hypothetical protein CEXT_275831 [Caerostris extrusa]